MNLDQLLYYRRLSDIAAHASVSLSPQTVTSYDAQAQADGKNAMSVTITGIFDALFGFDVRDLRQKIDDAKPQDLVLLIESPGGSFVDGLALYAAINRWQSDGMNVRAEAAGLVASAATLPFLAANERVAHEGSLFMIHNVWSMLMLAGTADELENYAAEQARVMRKMDDQNRAILTKNTNLGLAAVTTALDAETWYDCDEMIDNGICSEIIANKQEAGENNQLNEQWRTLAMQFRDQAESGSRI